MPTREPLSVASAIRKPPSTSPSSCARGTRTSSSTSCTVAEARRPILSSRRATLRPGAPRSTISSEMPSRPASGSVFAKTRKTPAPSPLVTKAFSPLSTKSSPSARAVVRSAGTSLPPPASVRQKAPTISPPASGRRKRSRCASLPKRYTRLEASPVEAASSSAVEAWARASSSSATASPSSPRPAPPHLGGNGRPKKPTSPMSARRSSGMCSCASISATRGRSSRSAKSRVVRRSAAISGGSPASGSIAASAPQRARAPPSTG